MIRRKKKATRQITRPVSLISLANRHSIIAEQYRLIRTNIEIATSINSKMKTILITSSKSEEGKSTTAANLAIVFADSGKKVLLVEADLRRPTVHKTFNLSNVSGLSTLLTGSFSFQEIIQTTMIENLYTLTSGRKPFNPSEILRSQKMDRLISDLYESFDLIIFDAPPLGTLPDAQILASKVDGTILVFRENYTVKDSAAKATKLLRFSNTNILGVIYTGSKSDPDEGQLYY